MLSEPAWQADLRRTVAAYVCDGDVARQGAYDALMEHVEAAFQRGKTAPRPAGDERRAKALRHARWEARRIAATVQTLARERDALASRLKDVREYAEEAPATFRGDGVALFADGLLELLATETR
jgi:uncharacterized protein YlxW (UPF0749 family)